MTLSYFDLLIPVFTKQLTSLRACLEKGAAHAVEIGLTEEQFLGQQLAPDMFPLVKQIQIATDNAKGAAARLTESEPLVLPDTETTVAELMARIDTVLEHLATYTPEQFADAAERQIVLPYFPDQYQRGSEYVLNYALPNFFFHVSMAYAIMRAQGAPLGKADYIGGLNLISL